MFHKKTELFFIALSAIVSLAALENPAAADVMVLCQNISGGVPDLGGNLGCTAQQGNSLTFENILFSDPAAVTSGATVTGVTVHTNTLFNFTSTTDSLIVNNDNGGNATIHATDGAVSNLSYYVSPTQTYGSTFNAYTVLDTNLDVGQNTSGTVRFTIQAQTGIGTPETFTTVIFALTGGANNFSFVASNNEVITNVIFNAANVSNVL